MNPLVSHGCLVTSPVCPNECIRSALWACAGIYEARPLALWRHVQPPLFVFETRGWNELLLHCSAPLSCVSRGFLFPESRHTADKGHTVPLSPSHSFLSPLSPSVFPSSLLSVYPLTSIIITTSSGCVTWTCYLTHTGTTFLISNCKIIMRPTVQHDF